MISRYMVFCQVIEAGSFTQAAEDLGYSQSAISQIIKALEQELGTLLIQRRKDGLALTNDGHQYFPYLQAIAVAEKALQQKRREINGLTDSTIRIGTFTSVSRTFLPPLIKAFKQQYPEVNFVIRQGEYTSIAEWVRNNQVDLGFVHTTAVEDIEMQILYQDEMQAVFAKGHPLAKNSTVSLSQLTKEPLILLDEGTYSVTLAAFTASGLTPKIEYEVYDDYSIIEMIRQGLGFSIMYQRVLAGMEEELVIRPIQEHPVRTVALAWRNWDTLSYASRTFAEFILQASAERIK
ncbi:LysR family transcriptional regulator [Enterococcus sp. AZ109]|uniref:LysR family transcriptional regulator n=1 Tax=Enterococcus sp. AZ109 TaxID=2774634 RepID=UPI003F27DC9B